MNPFRSIILSIIIVIFATGCSTTQLTGSWKNPEYFKSIDNVYIVGISKKTTTRRTFEDAFDKKFRTVGVKGLVSYKDFPTEPETNKELVMKKARDRGADSILLTRMIQKRTETVVSPGRVTSYATSQPDYNYSYNPYPYYRNYNTYYTRRYETIYEPPKVSEYQIATVESNLYDTASGELIWSAQLETTIEGNLRKMIEDFIAVVIRDMQQKALL